LSLLRKSFEIMRWDYCQLVKLGKGYSEVVKVISISILYHTMRVDEKENTDFIYYGTTELIGLHTKKPLIQSLERQKARPRQFVNISKYVLVQSHKRFKRESAR